MSNNFLVTLGNTLPIIVNIYIWVLVIRVLLTWVNPNPYSSFMRFLTSITDPVLRLARQWFPLRLGGLDFSPVVALLLLSFLAGTVGACLTQIGLGASPKVILPITAIMLLEILSYLTWLLIILMIARILISLVNPYRTNTLVLVVYGLTEPLLAPLRRWFPKGPKGLDVKAAVFLIGLFLFDTLITDTLVKVSKNWLISLV